VSLLFFSSAFCEPCIQTRAVLAEVSKLVPHVKIAELDIAREEEESQRAGIRMTPTVVILDEGNKEVFRAEGVPTINQVLVALAKAL
jgi:thiol-disulfide isomerase/thioredoxin